MSWILFDARSTSYVGSTLETQPPSLGVVCGSRIELGPLAFHENILPDSLPCFINHHPTSSENPTKYVVIQFRFSHNTLRALMFSGGGGGLRGWGWLICKGHKKTMTHFTHRPLYYPLHPLLSIGGRHKAMTSLVGCIFSCVATSFLLERLLPGDISRIKRIHLDPGLPVFFDVARTRHHPLQSSVSIWLDGCGTRSHKSA